MSLTLSKKNKIKDVLFEGITNIPNPHISIYLPRIDQFYTPAVRNEDFQHCLENAYYLLKKSYPLKKIMKIEDEITQSEECEVLSRTNNAIAFFYKEGFVKMLELPAQVNKKVISADSFHIKPIIEIEQLAESYFLYNLHKDRIDIYEGTVWEVKKTKTYHQAEFFPITTNKIEKKSTKVFIQKVLALEKSRLNKDERPIIVDGVSFLQTIFCNLAEVKSIRLIKNKYSGDLKNKIFENLKSYFEKMRVDVLRDFQSYRGTAKLLHSLPEAMKMAKKGKIQKLIVANDVVQWGLRMSNGEIIKSQLQKNGHDDDLLDDMAEEVLRSGGEVYCLPKHLLPFEDDFSAILR